MANLINGPESGGASAFTLSAAGTSTPVEIEGAWSFFLTNVPSWATVTLQRSVDRGASFQNAPRDAAGNAVAYDSSSSAPNCVIDEPAKGILYRVSVAGTPTTGNVTGYFVR